MGTSKKTILIIDDSREFRTIYRDRLISAGYDVRESSNGAEGIRDLGAHHTDLVLLDVAMPQMGGIEVLKAIRGNPLFRNLPVIMVTVFDERTYLYDELLEAGANAYLVKGKTTPDEVIGEVDKLLEMTHP